MSRFAEIRPLKGLGRLMLGLGLALLVTFGGLSMTGCSAFRDPLGTPVFSTKERFSRMTRDVGLEGKMLNDDFDRVFMLRPTSQLTPWHIP